MPLPVVPSAVDDLDPRVVVWSRRVRVLDRVAVVLSLLAAATATYYLVLDGGTVGDYLGLVVTVVGIGIVRDPFSIVALSLVPRLWLGAVVVAFGPLVASGLGGDPLVTWTIVVFTAFSITLRGLPGAPAGIVLGIAVYLAVIRTDGLGFVDPSAFIALTCSFTAAATGSAVRNYLRFRAESAERTKQTLASRDAETHQRVAEERLRIARDLHDIVGHEIAVLNIHLSVAQVNLPADAATARQSLESARTSVQSVLGETQRILHVLRTDGSEEPLGAPAVEFNRLPDLIESFQQAGADIITDLCPAPERLDPEVSTAAYRVVEEALTNAHKHGSGPVTVVTAVRGAELEITVANARTPDRGGGDAARSGRRGYGLIGMRERVASAGGRLVVRDETDDFVVQATLKIDGSAHA